MNNADGSHSLGGNYSDLLMLQPFVTRQKLAKAMVNVALKSNLNNDFIIDSTEGVDIFLGELVSVMVRDQRDGGLFGAKRPPQSVENSMENLDIDELPLDWEDILEEQSLITRLIHLIRSSDEQPGRELEVPFTNSKHAHKTNLWFSFYHLQESTLVKVVTCVSDLPYQL